MKKKRTMIFIIMIISVLLAGCNNAQSKSGRGWRKDAGGRDRKRGKDSC